MPTLKEIKGRISSVKSTLKITSAMKLVASAKLRKAQKDIESMRPYEAELQRILAAAAAGDAGKNPAPEAPDVPAPRVIVAMSSNSSLCGGFNASVIARMREERRKGDVVYSIGKKMADAMRRDGFPSPVDFTTLAEHPAYTPCADLAGKLIEDVAEGRVGEVLLVYNHFVSTGKQVPVVETLLPVSHSEQSEESAVKLPEDVILEPSAKELLEALVPKTVKLKLYAALLDSQAAEHAARTVAMQTATDNAENLLQELTLQYNKGRQQKITSEILDLAGGTANE